MQPIKNAEHLLSAGSAEEVYGIPGLPFAPAIRVTGDHELIFVAGVLGPATAEDPSESVEAEVRRAYRNLERVLESAGGTLGDIVSMTKYVKDIAANNAVVESVTKTALPHLTTTTTVEIVRLVPADLHFEVSAIAAVRTTR
ncbi:Rid family hydrolase [Microbacterium sp. LWH7-1.2]|jgi:2-iminobutanoate/2-iminopropanoate deaminase|uniref:RidA family protein n=1 Tax=Microbacterium sp. LWH7-1.2 TaxID=3135257 RepID=UPI003138DBDD